MGTDATQRQHWLIWDGTCGFCRRIVTWFQRQDRDRVFRATTCQGCPSPPMTPELRDRCGRAMQVITAGGEQLSGGRAVLYVLETVGWHPWLMRVAARPPWVWAVEAGYRVVAGNRQVFSRLLFRDQPTDGPAC